jgi:C-terminal processing protease CtpA/Prc
MADKMIASLEEQVRKKAYEPITDGTAFAGALTSHLRQVSRDLHLEVTFSPRPIPPGGRPGGGGGERERYARAAARNFGFQKLERLEGNVGYLALDEFAAPDLAGDVAATAMTFLSHTDALVIDLRVNDGGSPNAVALLCSYFFGPDPVHLSDLYYRPAKDTRQFWTLPYVPGKRYLGKDVYILTSKQTYSAAEGFTYAMRTLKRATVVGETTPGAAHPSRLHRINDHFAALIPTSRVISPVTGTDWEGVGVKPDVAVPPRLALKTAHLAAVKALAKKAADDPDRVKTLQETITTLERELKELKAGKETAANGARGTTKAF